MQKSRNYEFFWIDQRLGIPTSYSPPPPPYCPSKLLTDEWISCAAGQLGISFATTQIRHVSIRTGPTMPKRRCALHILLLEPFLKCFFFALLSVLYDLKVRSRRCGDVLRKCGSRVQGTNWIRVSTKSSKQLPEFPVRDPLLDDRFFFNLKNTQKKKTIPLNNLSILITISLHVILIERMNSRDIWISSARITNKLCKFSWMNFKQALFNYNLLIHIKTFDFSSWSRWCSP